MTVPNSTTTISLLSEDVKQIMNTEDDDDDHNAE